jgi:hypothetical protein
MFRMIRHLVIGLAMLPTVAARAEVWDLATGFSVHRNPDAPWTIGGKRFLTDALQIFPNKASVAAHYRTDQLVGWSPAGSVVPYVAQNASEQLWLYNGGAGIVAPGEVLVHPDSLMSVVRWTAPQTGLFEINTSFRRFESRFGYQSGYHVLHNNMEVPGADGVLSGFGGPAATASLNFRLPLNAEDALDFIVDMGPDGNALADGTIVGISIGTVAETIVTGDFNGDGSLNIHDLDLLYAAIRQGTNLLFDLHRNNNLDQEDRRVWVEDLRHTYFGDSDLDGEFNSTDLISVLATGKYENGIPHDASWADGDWNGDADFDSSDLVLAISSGGYEQGPRVAAVAAVPEPSAGVMLGVGVVFVLHRFRRRG